MIPLAARLVWAPPTASSGRVRPTLIIGGGADEVSIVPGGDPAADAAAADELAAAVCQFRTAVAEWYRAGDLS